MRTPRFSVPRIDRIRNYRLWLCQSMTTTLGRSWSVLVDDWLPKREKAGLLLAHKPMQLEMRHAPKPSSPSRSGSCDVRAQLLLHVPQSFSQSHWNLR
jgi:hypothetical protein